jgi:glycosyltransferase involved in cell wall biosynthesis
MTHELAVIVTAYNEADRLPATLAALRTVFPGAPVIVADDGSRDESARVAVQEGAELVRSEKTIGKGGVATLAALRVLDRSRAPGEGGRDGPGGPSQIVVLCDGDLGDSAAQLPSLVDAVRRGDGDLAVGAFARREGGGFGVALGFARWAVRRRAGIELQSPISGQRALRLEVLRAVVPFAHAFGMETAMNIDAARAGFRIVEVELELAHRATGRTLGGFVHRFRQLVDFARVYVSRR